MDYLIEIVGADNIKIGVIALAVLAYGVAKAWASMLVRRADQQWQDHGDDDDNGVLGVRGHGICDRRNCEPRCRWVRHWYRKHDER